MKNKKIVVNSLVLALGLGALSPAANAVIAGGSHLSPFVSEAYAAGEVIDFGEGRTLEVLEIPNIKYINNTLLQLNNLKIKLTGVSEGDKLDLLEGRVLLNMNGDPYKEFTVDEKNKRHYNMSIIGENLEIKDLNTGKVIGTTDDSGDITFSSEVEDMDSVELSISSIYPHNMFVTTKDTLSKKPFDVNIFANWTPKGEKRISKDIIKTQINFEDLIIEKKLRNNRKIMKAPYFESYNDSVYDFTLNETLYLGEPLKPKETYNLIVNVPEIITLTEEMTKKNLKSVNVVENRINESDYKKGIKDRFSEIKKENSIENFVDKLNVEFQEVTPSENGKQYKFTITNISNEVLGDDNFGVKIAFPKMQIEKSNLEFNVKESYATIKNNQSIKSTIIGPYETIDDNQTDKKSTFSVREIKKAEGIVGAEGDWKLDNEKYQPETEDQTTNLGKKVDPKDFISNIKDLPEGSKFEYKEVPDFDTAGEQDVTIVVTYPDGSTGETNAILKVVPGNEEINFNTKYQADSKLKFKEEKVVQEGKKGSKTNNGGGDIQVKEPSVDKIISVGNVEKIEESIPHEEKRILDKTLTPGTEKVVQEGKDGIKTITKTYTVDPAKGLVADNPKVDEKVTPAEDRIIHYNDGHPVGEDQTTEVGNPLKPEDFITNIDDLPEGSTFEFKETPDFDTAGEQDVVVIVTYPDGSTEEVPTKLTVTEKEELPQPKGQDVTKNIGDPVDPNEFISNIPDLPEGSTIEFKEIPSTEKPGEFDVTIIVTYPDGEVVEVPVKLTVKDKPMNEKHDPQGQDVEKYVGDPVSSKEFIVDLEDLPEGTAVRYKDEEPSTDEPGEFPVDLVVEYPDGSTDEVTATLIVKERPQNELYDPNGQDQTTKVGNPLKAEDFITNIDDLPEGTRFEYKETPDFDTAGEQDVVIIVTYPDGTVDEVPVKLTVIDEVNPNGQDLTRKVGETVKPEEFVTNVDELPEGTRFEYKETPDFDKAGTQDVVIVATYPDGTVKELNVKLTLTEEEKPSAPTQAIDNTSTPTISRPVQSSTPVRSSVSAQTGGNVGLIGSVVAGLTAAAGSVFKRRKK